MAISAHQRQDSALIQCCGQLLIANCYLLTAAFRSVVRLCLIREDPRKSAVRYFIVHPEDLEPDNIFCRLVLLPLPGRWCRNRVWNLKAARPGACSSSFRDSGVAPL